MEPVKFVPFQVFIDPAFWAEVSRRRLEEWKLETPEVRLVASYGICKVSDCTITIGHDALTPSAGPDRDVHLNGTLFVCNTLKDFKTLDLKKILEKEAGEVWKHIGDCKDSAGTPEFSKFYLAAFADLKNYSYYFITCVPALLYPTNIQKQSQSQEVDSNLYKIAITRYSSNPSVPFFIVSNERIEEFPSILQAKNSDDYLLVFPNPSTFKNNPGWPLRNILASIAFNRPDLTSIRVLALRGGSAEDSESFQITWSPTSVDSVPNAVGWSKVEHINLKSVFDPAKLMENGVEMNLRLIRWRMVPSLKLEPLSGLKVLIMGAGTLGCNLARSLLGWGIRNFTFVDNSVVSYNNPVRQSLYDFEDCKAGNRQKSEAAANALKRIYPSVNSKGVSMKIPMPGHPISASDVENVMEDCRRLEEMIEDHNVIFLVMDSRESRWLPTVLAARHQKLAITVALGFDSFVVMRHGISLTERSQSGSASSSSPKNSVESSPETVIPGTELGCYYCSDVTAPGNSVEDRTLDQNCTISRAGISGIAAGIATELLISLTQHEQGSLAPALLASVDESSSLLGATPHQIRGFLSRYQFMTPTVRRFEKCTACGQGVQEQLANKGFDFLLSVFQNPNNLEQVSGLTELQNSVNDLDLMAATDDDSE